VRAQRKTVACNKHVHAHTLIHRRNWHHRPAEVQTQGGGEDSVLTTSSLRHCAKEHTTCLPALLFMEKYTHMHTCMHVPAQG
jgi:hypothetical protein